MPIIDVSFPISGERLPVDHGYALMAALARKVPWIHEGDVGIHPVRGILLGDRTYDLTRSSKVTLRLSHEVLPHILPLAGQALDVDGFVIRLGVPQIQLLRPASTCFSRLVIIKGFMEPESFLEAIKRQMDTAGIRGEARLARQRHPGAQNDGVPAPFVRRTLQIKGINVVGFPVVVSGLDETSSLALQTSGLGGRRRMGCGVFVPVGQKAG